MTSTITRTHRHRASGHQLSGWGGDTPAQAVTGAVSTESEGTLAGLLFSPPQATQASAPWETVSNTSCVSGMTAVLALGFPVPATALSQVRKLRPGGQSPGSGDEAGRGGSRTPEPGLTPPSVQPLAGPRVPPTVSQGALGTHCWRRGHRRLLLPVSLQSHFQGTSPFRYYPKSHANGLYY